MFCWYAGRSARSSPSPPLEERAGEPFLMFAAITPPGSAAVQPRQGLPSFTLRRLDWLTVVQSLLADDNQPFVATQALEHFDIRPVVKSSFDRDFFRFVLGDGKDGGLHLL